MVRLFVNMMTARQGKIMYAKELGGKLTELRKKRSKEEQGPCHPESQWLSESAIPALSNLCPGGRVDHHCVIFLCFPLKLAVVSLRPFSTKEELRKQHLGYKEKFYKVKLPH